MTRFSIQPGYSNVYEGVTIIKACLRTGERYKVVAEPEADTIPIGSVEFCESVFGEQPLLKDFFPSCLEQPIRDAMGENALIPRQLFTFSHGDSIASTAFVKLATAWKSDTLSATYGAGTRFPAGQYWLAPSICLKNEWRYYIANGIQLAAGWYRGPDEDRPPPDLGIEWPAGFSGAVDFGESRRGPKSGMILIEAHAPFACGWYHDDHMLHHEWQVKAWNCRDHWLLTKYGLTKNDS